MAPLESLGEQAYWKTECENEGERECFLGFLIKKNQKREERTGDEAFNHLLRSEKNIRNIFLLSVGKKKNCSYYMQSEQNVNK